MSRSYVDEFINAQETVQRLLDGYEEFGFLYDEEGMVLEKYHMPYCTYDEEGEPEFMMDAEGRRLLDASDEHSWDSAVLYVKDYMTITRTGIEEQNLLKLSGESILKVYLRPHIQKLIAMLRRGYNYAGVQGVGYDVEVEVLTSMLVTQWKKMVLETLKKYKDKENLIVVSPANVDPVTFFSEEAMQAARKQIMENEKRILDVIRASFSDREWNSLPSVRFLRAVAKATDTDADFKKNNENF